MTVSDDTVYESVLLSEYHCEESDGSELDDYRYFADETYHPISKEKFDEMYQELFTENEDLNLKCIKIDGNKLENATESKQRELLLEAYRSFSHKEFAVG